MSERVKQIGVQRNTVVNANPVFELTCPHCGEKQVVLIQVAGVSVGIGIVDKKTGKPLTTEKSVVGTRAPEFKPRTVA